jgi:hypothetical protein
VLLRLPPELVVVLALDDVATHAGDLLHSLMVRGTDLNAKQQPQRDISTAPADPCQTRKLDERIAK